MSFVPDPAEKTVSVPVRVRDGRVEFYFGGPLPPIRDGAIGELVVSAAALREPKWLKLLGEERRVLFLGRDADVLVGLHPTTGQVPGPEINRKNLPLAGFTAYATVELQENLFLMLRGTKSPSLSDVPCKIPALNGVLATSLNHAYTLLSERFEPLRRSHTGNVFRKIFYLEKKSGSWHLLDDLRTDREELFESRFQKS